VGRVCSIYGVFIGTMPLAVAVPKSGTLPAKQEASCSES
jgi:hypothetical protein